MSSLLFPQDITCFPSGVRGIVERCRPPLSTTPYQGTLVDMWVDIGGHWWTWVDMGGHGGT